MTKKNATLPNVYAITLDSRRMAITSTTKKAAAKALGLSAWISRQHLKVSTSEEEIARARLADGSIISTPDFKDGSCPWSGADAPRYLTAETQPARKISAVPNFNGILDNLHSALAECSDMTSAGMALIARQLVRAGYATDEGAAQKELWERLVTTALPKRNFDGKTLAWDTHPNYTEARACFNRMYEVTDRIPYTDDADRSAKQVPAGMVVRGCLLSRFAARNFKVPSVFVVERWIARAGLEAPAPLAITA